MYILYTSLSILSFSSSLSVPTAPQPSVCMCMYRCIRTCVYVTQTRPEERSMERRRSLRRTTVTACGEKNARDHFFNSYLVSVTPTTPFIVSRERT